MSDPAGLNESTVRALARELVELRHELDTVKRGLRASQLGYSSVHDGAITFVDADGVVRGRGGKQPDGKFGWGAVNGDPPPRPEGIELVGTTSGVAFRWTGAFAGIKPSDFTYVNFHLSPAGPTFIHDAQNLVGNLIGAGNLPVVALGGSPINAGLSYWGRAVAYNSSGVASEASFTVGPATPTPVVASEVLQGIVDELALADDAVTKAKIAAAAVDGTKIAPESIETPHLTTGSVTSEIIAAAQILAHHLTADSVTADTIQALSILADHIAANAINAGHIQAGSITAEHLSAVLVLASRIIAGDPDGWHLELGDSQTPILWWNGVDTGFALSRDDATGQSNVYLSGRVEFGNGSQIESDYIDLAEQASTGWQQPKPRQKRHWIASNPTTSITAQWTSATQRGSLCLMGVFQVAASGSTPPNCGTPAGATIIDSQVSGNTRLTLFMVQNAPTSRSTESFGSSAGAARWAITLTEFTGLNAGTQFDVTAWNAGTGTTANSGTTPVTAQANELHFAVFGSAAIGFTNGKNGQWSATGTNGFSKILEGDGTAGHGIAAYTKIATSTAASSTAVTANKSVPYIGIIATFRSAQALGVPPQPRASTVRMFAQPRGGYSAPHIIDGTGAVYPFGRVPYCRVTLNAPTPGDLPSGAVAPGPGYWCGTTDVWAQGDWIAAADPYQMVAISSSAGTYTNVTIPVTGLYRVSFKAIFQPSSSTEHVGTAYVSRNTRTAEASIARDSRAHRRYGPGDWSPVQADRIVALNAGDVLYWGTWASIQSFVTNNRSNIPTEVSVIYVGAI